MLTDAQNDPAIDPNALRARILINQVPLLLMFIQLSVHKVACLH